VSKGGIGEKEKGLKTPSPQKGTLLDANTYYEGIQRTTDAKKEKPFGKRTCRQLPTDKESRLQNPEKKKKGAKGDPERERKSEKGADLQKR